MNGTELFAMWFKDARESLKLTQAQLAKKLHVNPQTISNWENKLCLPPSNKINRIAKAFGISEAEVLRVRTQSEYEEYREDIQKKGVFIIPSPGEDIKKLVETIKGKNPWDEGLVPEIDSRYKGDPDMLLNKVESWQSTWFNGRLIPRRMFAFRLLDKSMEPSFPQGSVIIADRDARVPRGSHKALIKLKGGQEILFRIYEETGSQITLRPLNPNFPTISVKKDDIHRIYYAVKSIMDIRES